MKLPCFVNMLKRLRGVLWIEEFLQSGRFAEPVVAWWRHMTAYSWVNIGLGNGWLPDSTKSFPQPMLNYHQMCSVEDKFAHDDVIKWKHFPRYWPFVLGFHLSPINSPQKGQWRRALIFSLICAWINGWVNNREAGDLGRYRAHYDVTVMQLIPRIHILMGDFSLNNSRKATHSSPVRASYGMSFVRAKYDQSFVTITFGLCTPPCCIWPRYIESLLY